MGKRILSTHARPGSGLGFQIAAIDAIPCVLYIVAKYGRSDPMGAIYRASATWRGAWQASWRYWTRHSTSHLGRHHRARRLPGDELAYFGLACTGVGVERWC